jgi:nitroreductase
MDLEQAIRSRRAVRAFTIDDATIHRLINAAVWEPSAINEQPWLFTVVREKDTLFGYRHGGKRIFERAAKRPFLRPHSGIVK